MSGLAAALEHDRLVLDRHLREGRFQRSLSLIAGLSGLLGGLDVAFEHRQGSYGQRVMYTPLLASAAVAAAGVAGAIRPRLARTVLPWTSAILLADGVVGFGFHIRGIARKPGGWRLPKYNILMGPPLFAPLLLGIGGFLGVVAARLRPEEQPALVPPTAVRQGRIGTALCVATSLSAALNGMEALSSHYRAAFNTWAQWVPIGVAPALTLVGAWAAVDRRGAGRALPAASAVALAAGSVGFFYHVRGAARRPGGLKQAFYNLTYGPPTFAPLLFAASGFMGLLASRLRR